MTKAMSGINVAEVLFWAATFAAVSFLVRGLETAFGSPQALLGTIALMAVSWRLTRK